MNRKDRLKVDEIEAKAKADPASITEEDRAFVMNYDIDRRRKRAVGAKRKEAIFDILGKGLRMYAGVPLGPGLREKREALEAAEREQAREYADQDTFTHRTAYGEKKAKFIDDLANRASASLSAEDNEEIEKAKLEVQREKDLRDFLVAGGGTVQKEDLAAQKAAARYLMGQSRGGASQMTMTQTMAGLETEYALDRYAHWMNIYLGEAGRNAVSAHAQSQNRANLTAGEIAHGQAANTPAGLTKGDIEATRALMVTPSRGADPSNTYPYIKQQKIDAGTLKPSPDRLTEEQRALVASGMSPEEATRRATAALDRLEKMPAIQDQIKAIAAQNLTSKELDALQYGKDEDGNRIKKDFTAGDVFDKVYGQTQEQAHALDTETESEVEWAMKRLQRTGNFDPLTSNEAFLADMKSKGLSPKDYAEFLRRNAQLKREREGTSPDKLERLSKQYYDETEEATRLATQTNLRERRGPAQWFSKSAKAAGADSGGSGDPVGGVPGAVPTVESSEDGDPKVEGTEVSASGAGKRGGAKIKTRKEERKKKVRGFLPGYL